MPYGTGSRIPRERVGAENVADSTTYEINHTSAARHAGRGQVGRLGDD
jgi:hypothetical protein